MKFSEPEPEWGNIRVRNELSERTKDVHRSLQDEKFMLIFSYQIFSDATEKMVICPRFIILKNKRL